MMVMWPRGVLTAPSPACRAASALLPNSLPYFTLKLLAATTTISKFMRHRSRSGTAPRNAHDISRTPHTCPHIVGPSSSPSASRCTQYMHLRCSPFPCPTWTCSHHHSRSHGYTPFYVFRLDPEWLPRGHRLHCHWQTEQ